MLTTIRLAGRKVHVVHDALECVHCENHQAHVALEPQAFLQDEITRAADGDASTLADFRELALAHGLLHDASRITDSKILEHVAWLLETGRLVAVECRVRLQQSPLAAAPAARPRSTASTPSRQRAVEEVGTPIKTWVEIELLDDAGDPVADERYVVKIPEGVTKNGRLNSRGRARISEIDPGVCEISFPDIDGREWKPI